VSAPSSCTGSSAGGVSHSSRETAASTPAVVVGRGADHAAQEALLREDVRRLVGGARRPERDREAAAADQVGRAGQDLQRGDAAGDIAGRRVLVDRLAVVQVIATEVRQDAVHALEDRPVQGAVEQQLLGTEQLRDFRQDRRAAGRLTRRDRPETAAMPAPRRPLPIAALLALAAAGANAATASAAPCCCRWPGSAWPCCRTAATAGTCSSPP